MKTKRVQTPSKDTNGKSLARVPLIQVYYEFTEKEIIRNYYCLKTYNRYAILASPITIPAPPSEAWYSLAAQFTDIFRDKPNQSVHNSQEL